MLLRSAAPDQVAVTPLGHVIYTNLNATEASASATGTPVDQRKPVKSRRFAGIETGIFLVHHRGAQHGDLGNKAVAVARNLMPSVIRENQGKHLQVECGWRSDVPRMVKAALFSHSQQGSHLPLWNAMLRVVDAFAAEAVRLIPCEHIVVRQHVLVVDCKLLLATCKLIQSVLASLDRFIKLSTTATPLASQFCCLKSEILENMHMMFALHLL